MNNLKILIITCLTALFFGYVGGYNSERIEHSITEDSLRHLYLTYDNKYVLEACKTIDLLDSITQLNEVLTSHEAVILAHTTFREKVMEERRRK